jgi:hypothetical protein
MVVALVSCRNGPCRGYLLMYRSLFYNSLISMGSSHSLSRDTVPLTIVRPCHRDGSGSLTFFFLSRIRGVKKHRIQDPAVHKIGMKNKTKPFMFSGASFICKRKSHIPLGSGKNSSRIRIQGVKKHRIQIRIRNT